MPKKTLAWILVFLIIVNIPFILYLSNFKILLYDENYYKKEFQKHNVYENLNNYDVDGINNDVLDYFKNKDEIIKNDFFNEKEKSHMSDVKNLINDVFYLFNLLILNFIILLIILYFVNKKRFLKYIGFSLAAGGALTFLHAFFFWFTIKFNFGKTFTVFHEIFFKDNWIFNPLSNKIVVLYPQGFFFDFVYNIVIRTLVMTSVLILIGLVIFLRAKRSKKQSINKKSLKSKSLKK